MQGEGDGSWHDPYRKPEGSWADPHHEHEGSWGNPHCKPQGSWRDPHSMARRLPQGAPFAIYARFFSKPKNVPNPCKPILK